MKIIRIIRNCAKLPLLLILATLTVSAHASTGETLKSLHEMRTLNYSILGNYYMFSGLEGDSRYGRQMDSGIKKFDTHMDAVLRQDMSNVSELANVVSNWKEYKNLINTNRSEFLKQGYASARLVDDLVKKTQILNSSLNNLYSTLKSSKNFPVSKWTEYSREMSLIIRTLTTEYAARSTSGLGQIMIIDINEGGMEKQGQKFTALLNKLKKAPNKAANIDRTLDQIDTKWTFISKSISNYNENTVPFIVNSYGDRITKSLETISKHYSSSVQAKK